MAFEVGYYAMTLTVVNDADKGQRFVCDAVGNRS